MSWLSVFGTLGTCREHDHLGRSAPLLIKPVVRQRDSDGQRVSSSLELGTAPACPTPWSPLVSAALAPCTCWDRQRSRRRWPLSSSPSPQSEAHRWGWRSAIRSACALELARLIPFHRLARPTPLILAAAPDSVIDCTGGACLDVEVQQSAGCAECRIRTARPLPGCSAPA